MTPEQRQMIKEAYQEGYYQALDENFLRGILAALRGLFRGGKTVSNVQVPKKKFKLKPLDPPEPVFKKGNITRTDDPFGPNKLTAAEDRYLANLQDRIDDLEGEIIDQMGNDGREIIDNVNTIGKNLPPEQKINYYREILRQEAGDLPDINNPLDDLP